MTRKSEQSVIAELNGLKAKAKGQPTPTAGVGFAPQESTAATLRITDSINETPDEPKAEPQPEPVVEESASVATPAPSISPEALQQALAQVINPLQTQLNELTQRNQALETQLSESQQKAADSAHAAAVLEGLGKLTGQSEFPNVNTNLSPNRDRLTGRIAEFDQVRNSAGPGGSVGYRHSEKFGAAVPVYNTAVVDSWMRAQLQGADGQMSRAKQIEILNELESYGKQHGLFRGQAITNTATTKADIPGGFLDVLSSYMRVTSAPGYVWHQFPVTIHNFTRGEGELVKVPRAIYNTTIASSDERLLSGSGTYAAITGENESVATSTRDFILKEYGRGKPGAPPIAVSAFVEAFSMIPLMGILEQTLMRDYYAFEDLIIRESLSAATIAYYNNGDALTTAAANIVSGGQMTRKFLSELYTQARVDQILPLDVANNAYALVMHSRALNQFRNSLEEKFAPATPDQVQALTNILMSNYPQSADLRVSGYVGMYEGFHIFESNSFSSGAAAADSLVDVETTTAASQTNATFRTSYLLGGGALGRAIGGSGFQILFDEKTDFGRINRAIWHCYEAHGALDVDSAVSGQQTRVYKIRTSDTALTAA